MTDAEKIDCLEEIVFLLVKQLPKHAADCWSWNVHPSNVAQYCNCDNKKIRRFFDKRLKEYAEKKGEPIDTQP